MQKIDLETVSGIVKTITFHNTDNGYTVAKIEPEGGICVCVGQIVDRQHNPTQGQSARFLAPKGWFLPHFRLFKPVCAKLGCLLSIRHVQTVEFVG